MIRAEFVEYLILCDACVAGVDWFDSQDVFGPELLEKCPHVEWLDGY